MWTKIEDLYCVFFSAETIHLSVKYGLKVMPLTLLISHVSSDKNLFLLTLSLTSILILIQS